MNSLLIHSSGKINIWYLRSSKFVIIIKGKLRNQQTISIKELVLFFLLMDKRIIIVLDKAEAEMK